ncbi:MAG: protein-disulfide reductase DsbD family protein [Oceanococcus sp.]
MDNSAELKIVFSHIRHIKRQQPALRLLPAAERLRAALVLIGMNLPHLVGLISLLLSCTAGAALDRPNKVAAEIFAGPAPDQPNFLVALRLDPSDGWHTYWKNPGDAGLATNIRWQSVPGIDTGPLLWPAPNAYREGELTTYGYGEEHHLLTRIHIDKALADETLITLKARWLVCKDICIPESLETTIKVGQIRNGSSDNARAVLTNALQSIPEILPEQGRFRIGEDSLETWIPLPEHWLSTATEPQWFSGREETVDHVADSQWWKTDNGIVIQQTKHPDFTAMDAYSGVITFVSGNQAQAISVQLHPGEIPDTLQPWQVTSSNAANSPSLWIILLMAFAGGLILNLMPCVFPVLSLKAMSLARTESLLEKRKESLAYTAGVLLSFLLIAATLLALRAGGAALGWGFQLQNPVIVGALASLMLVMGFALLGWSQIGMGLMGTGQNLTQHSGLRGAFFTGVLAVVVASPCSAPFMGSALGFAVLQPAPIALSIFLTLGLGLAAPLAALPWTPGIAQRLPKPGPWMESLKHWMAIPMLLTAAWLFWVLWRQSGHIGLLVALSGATLITFGMRRKPCQIKGNAWHKALIAGGAGLLLIPGMLTPPVKADNTLNWQSWSPEAVQAAQAQDRLVFVDFTADWCLSCIANERAVLNSERIQNTFQTHDVLLLKADWTQYDPEITTALAQFGRNGVPLYLLYPRGGAAAKVLPQILSRNLVEQAVLSVTANSE